MADQFRLPNGYSPSMHPQQMGQPHLNQPQDGHPPVPGFPDQGPMWQQMQQIQNQFRPQSTGLEPNHVNPQVAEMMRNSQLGRQGQQPGQQFPPFLDQQSNSFQNMAPSLQSLNGRFQQPSNPDAHRQLDLLALAHQQQQPQNGPIDFAKRMHQQAVMNGQRMGQPPQPQQHSEPFLGPPGGGPMRQPSPSHPQGGPQPGLPQASQSPQVTRASYVALQERAANLKSIITNQEQQLTQLTGQRTRIGDASFMDKVRTVSADLKNRKEHYARLVNFINQIQSHIAGGQNMGGGMGPGPMGMPPPQPNGPSWMQGSPQPGGQPAQFNPNQGQQPPPQNVAAPSPPNGHPNYSVPPRPGQPQFPNPMQPGQGFQQPNPAVGGGQTPFPSIPPLDKLRFEGVFKNWCNQRNIQLNPRMLTIDSRPIDLHDLHTQVMVEGGATVVSQKDLWAVIGGRLGFVQFSASETEPAKSGPGVAQTLAHAYKEYLAAFDNVYLNTVMDQRRKSANQQHPMGGNPAMGGAPGRPAPTITDPNQMQLVMQCVNLPANELRRRGIPEHIIQFVETNRTTLMQNRIDQAMFHDKLAPQAPMQPNNLPNNGSPANGGNMAAMNNGRMSGGGPMAMRGMLDGQPPQRPTRESMQAAMVQLAKLKSEYGPERMLSNVPPIEIPPEQRMEYNNILEQLHRACMELDHKLPMILAVLKNENIVRRYVIIVQTAIQQRAMITSGSTRFLVTLDTLRNMLGQVQGITENFATILSSLMGKPPMGGVQPMGANQPLRPPMPNTMGGQMGIPSSSTPPQPPLNRPNMPMNTSMNPSMNPSMSTPMNPPMTLNLPAKRRAPNQAGPATPTPMTPAAPTPTPPPVSTPAHNAPTPRDMASPQAPKSPKGKAAAKPKPAPRRKASIKAANTPQVPAPEPVTAPSPAGSNKRAREEDASPSLQNSNVPGMSVANEPSPPKRIKSEWDGAPSEVIMARAEQVENVKTEEDSAGFLEQMTELLKMASSGGQDRLTSDFSAQLDDILKGYGQDVADDTAMGLPSMGIGDPTAAAAAVGGVTVSAISGAEEFVEFFDFSSFGTEEDDMGSKAATPDLIPSTSTNPSPESNTELDASHQTPAPFSDSQSEDYLPVLKAVDGGESGYYNAGSSWKWDGPMHSDNPWLILPPNGPTNPPESLQFS